MNVEKQAKKFMKGAKSNWNKAKRTYVCRSLKDLIRAYRACTTRSEERALVKKEAAHIRDLFREGDRHFRRQNIAKLLFFHMNGYPTDFGITECIKLCASNKFADKRVAYLGMTLLVHETDSVLMLMTNSLKQDLTSPDVHMVSLALNVLGDIASPEMVRELMPEIETHMRSPNPHVRKKAGLVAVRAVRKLSAEDTLNVLNYVPAFLDTRSSAVHVSGAALISALCAQDPSNAQALAASTLPTLLSILSEHATGQPPSRNADLYGSSHDAGNPFVVSKLLTSLRTLLSHAPQTDSVTSDAAKIVRAIASKFDTSKTAGCAVLYECVRTASLLRSHEVARPLATKILGRFLDHKEATVRFIALEELTALVDAEGASVLSSMDGLNAKLLSGLRETDPTVREQAVELVFRTTDASNVDQMVSELAEYVRNTPVQSEDAIRDACEKIFILADDFAPSDEWRVDTFVTALTLGHHCISDDLLTCLIAFISSHTHIRSHAVRVLFDKVLRPFASHAPIDAEDLLEGNRVQSGGPSLDDLKRRPNCEIVALQVIGEYASVGPSCEVDMQELLRAFDQLATLSGAVVEDSTPVHTADELTIQNSAVRDVALSGLLKIAVRALGGVASDGMNSVQATDIADVFAVLESGTELPRLPAPPVSDEVALAMVPTKENEGIASEFDPDLAVLEALSNPSERALVSVVPATQDNDVVQRVHLILRKAQKSSNVEVQKRSCEYVALLNAGSSAACAVAPSPPMRYIGVRATLAESLARQHVGEASAPLQNENGGGFLLDLLEDDNEIAAVPAITSGDPGSSALAATNDDPLAATNDDPLAALGALALVEDSAPSNPANKGGDTDILALGLGEEPAKVGVDMQPVVMTTMSGLVPDIDTSSSGIIGGHSSPAPSETTEKSTVLLDEKDVLVSAAFSKDSGGDPGETIGLVLISNKSSRPLKNCVLQLAVPKYMKLNMEASSSSDAPVGGEITQRVTMTNTAHGVKPIQLRFRIEFMLEGANDVTLHEGVAANIEM